MTVLLSRAYQGYSAGQTVELATSTEAALIAQGLATAALTTNTTTGALTANAPKGNCAIAAGQSSVVITNSFVDANSVVFATIAQASADTTLTSIVRIVCSAGQFTLFGNANATATVLVDWAVITPSYISSGS
jgi:hypothetical protein